MRSFMILLASFALLGGCASTDIEKRDSRAVGERLPRPERIIVYDINATPDDVPPTSALTGRYVAAKKPPSPEEVKLGRELGRLVADRLVESLRKMGMTAHRARQGPPPRVGNLVLTGQFITIDEGDKTQRVTIGFGKGSSELKTHIEGYLVTHDGLRLLGSRQVGAEGGKKPGMLAPTVGSIAMRNPVGLVVGSAVNINKEASSETLEGAAERTADEIAKELEKIFRSKGWI